jgi:hypothetical protein
MVCLPHNSIWLHVRHRSIGGATLSVVLGWIEATIGLPLQKVRLDILDGTGPAGVAGGSPNITTTIFSRSPAANARWGDCPSRSSQLGFRQQSCHHTATKRLTVWECSPQEVRRMLLTC